MYIYIFKLMPDFVRKKLASLGSPDNVKDYSRNLDEIIHFDG